MPTKNIIKIKIIVRLALAGFTPKFRITNYEPRCVHAPRCSHVVISVTLTLRFVFCISCISWKVFVFHVGLGLVKRV